MKYQKLILILLFVPLLLAGCLSKKIFREKVNDQINVFGIKLYSDVNYREIYGVVAVEEPCLRGYERSFDGLDFVIGYGFDNRIRKITTRNTSTSILGIKPGMTFGDCKQTILQAGFDEQSAPFIFRANGYSLTLHVDDNNAVFGLTLEYFE